MSSTNWRSEVLDHVSRYGLSTSAALKKAVFGGDGTLAAGVIESLLREGALYRHRQVLCRSKTPLAAATVQRRYAALHLSVMQTPSRPLVSRSQVERILAPALEHLGAPAPTRARCILDRDKRLSLLRVQPAVPAGRKLDLNLELTKLQTLVERGAFRPWAYLAMCGGFSIS